MSQYYRIKGDTLTSIADAIREKIGNGGGNNTSRYARCNC